MTTNPSELVPLKLAVPLFLSRPSLQTLHRWSKTGVVVNGKQVLLETYHEGGRKYTTKKWCAEFVQRTQGLQKMGAK